MCNRLSASATLELNGLEYEDLEDLVCDSIVPACCDSGCEVEPDGHCEHGHPSLFLAMGVI